MADDDALFRKGMPIRREVLGPDYVDASMARADEFMMAFQRATTAWAWGWASGDPTLDRKTRSLMNLAMLTALNRAGNQAARQRRAQQRRHRRGDQGRLIARDSLLRHSGRARRVPGGARSAGQRRHAGQANGIGIPAGRRRFRAAAIRRLLTS